MKETPPFVKNKKLYLGGKKKQKGGFFGIRNSPRCRYTNFSKTLR